MGWFELATITTIGLCVLAIFTSILINFVEVHHRGGIKRRKKSIVETGTMTLFFVFFYLLIRLRIGVFHLESLPVRIVCVVLGLVIIVFGCCVNIAGRVSLGRNWANQVTIYDDQELVELGPFKWVRHPLYASLMWMFYGASLVYVNYAAFLANTLIFVPFMYYRARQEEALLVKEFPKYAEYRQRVGMFF